MASSKSIWYNEKHEINKLNSDLCCHRLEELSTTEHEIKTRRCEKRSHGKGSNVSFIVKQHVQTGNSRFVF